MARVFVARAIRVRRAHRTFSTEAEYGSVGLWEDLEVGVTTLPVAWFVTSGHNLGPTYRGLPTATTADPAWTHWDRDQTVPDVADDTGDTTHTIVENTAGDPVAFFVVAPTLDANPTGTLDLGDPTDRASMRSTILTDGNVDQLRTMTGKNVPYGSSQMDVAKYSVREVGWRTLIAGLPFEVDR